jgi:hypothetical protein
MDKGKSKKKLSQTIIKERREWGKKMPNYNLREKTKKNF